MEEVFSYEKDYRYEMILGEEKIMSPIRFRHYVVHITAYLFKENKFVLDNVYHAYEKDSLKLMTKKEKLEIQDKIKLSIFDDLTINVSDIFLGEY